MAGQSCLPDTYRVAAPPTDLSVTTDPLTANTYTYVNGNPQQRALGVSHVCGDGGNRRRSFLAAPPKSRRLR